MQKVKTVDETDIDYGKPNMRRKIRLCRDTCFLFLGLFLISLGTLLLLHFDTLYDTTVKNALAFYPTSETYKAWHKNDPPLVMDVYMFNWTNPEEIKEEGVKPRFEEVGPYRFREVKEKINISLNDNGTVTYRLMRQYFFHEEDSPRQLSDIITTINAVSLTAAYQARNWGFFSKKGISLSLSAFSQINVTKTAAELLFDGYYDNFLSAAGVLPFVNVQDKFGFFYKKNATVGTEGIFSMSTRNDENFGKILTWNYNNRTNFYEGSCGDIRGSAGEFYPMDRTKDTIEIFSSELCKNAILKFEEEVDILGVKGYKYSARDLFDNGTVNPENTCFCNGECVPSGVLNVSTCRQNSPTFLSLPHFYDADPYFVNAVEGLKPEKKKHEFYITLEPKSGVVMDLAARMQLNMLLQPIEYIELYEGVPTVFFPILYFTQNIRMKDEVASSLKLIQYLPLINRILCILFLVIGGLVLLLLACSCICCKVRKYKEYKIPHEEVPLGITATTVYNNGDITRNN